MNNTETAELLRMRRNLTGATYNDDTVTDWQLALRPWSYEQCREALATAALAHPRVSIAHLAEYLPAHQSIPRDTRHPASCMCEGRGWIEIEQHDDHETWKVWDHCPNGPITAFHEPDDDGPVVPMPDYIAAALHRLNKEIA
jgi:hypothetical protein